MRTLFWTILRIWILEAPFIKLLFAWLIWFLTIVGISQGGLAICWYMSLFHSYTVCTKKKNTFPDAPQTMKWVQDRLPSSEDVSKWIKNCLRAEETLVQHNFVSHQLGAEGSLGWMKLALVNCVQCPGAGQTFALFVAVWCSSAQPLGVQCHTTLKLISEARSKICGRGGCHHHLLWLVWKQYHFVFVVSFFYLCALPSFCGLLEGWCF